MSELPAYGFYGSTKRKWIGLERSIDNAVKKYHEQKIPVPYKSRLLGPSAAWKTFFRQQDAFNYCRSRAKDLHVFAFESRTFDNNTGQRLYLVASYPQFWHYYRQMEEEGKRCHYEVIPEGAVCKLYFDLEFSVTHNPLGDGEKMVEALIKYVCLCLDAEYNINCTREDILDLEASTSTKFSRHLIFQLKRAAFQDNVHTGNFVQYIFSQVRNMLNMNQFPTTESKLSDISNDQTLSDNKKTKTKCQSNNTVNCEPGHVKNECVTRLEPAGSDVEKPDTSSSEITTVNKISDEKPVEKSEDSASSVSGQQVDQVDDRGVVPDNNRTVSQCVTQGNTIGERSCKGTDLSPELDPKYVKVLQQMTSEELQCLFVQNKHGDKVLFCDTGVYTKNRNFRLYMSSKFGKKNPLLLAPENKYKAADTSETQLFYASLVANIEYHRSTRVLSSYKEVNLSSGKRKNKDKQNPGDSLDGYSVSPYPEVDEYIKSLITQQGGKGVIRHWIYFQQGEMLIYEIAHNRFCHNIRRQHRSNNIMYVVDLRRGVFYQKCHDPDCYQQNFKSEEWELPRYLLPGSYFDDDGDEFEDDLEMDDEELLNKTVELEEQHYGGQVS